MFAWALRTERAASVPACPSAWRPPGPNPSYRDLCLHFIAAVGRLIEAGFSVNHRIPSQANEDGFSLKVVPLYGGTITTPDDKTIIVMEYAQHMCRLPLSSNKRFSKPKLLPRATSEKFVDLHSEFTGQGH